MSRNESDYVIVGAGAAGCVIASRLTKDPGVSVTLLEAGGVDSGIFLKIPGLSFLVMLDDRYNWNFEINPISSVQKLGSSSNLDATKKDWSPARP
jgi:choline dehydrogenase